MATYRSTYCPYCKSPIKIQEATGWNHYEDHFGDPQALCYKCFKPYNTGKKYWSNMDSSEKITVYLRLFLSIFTGSFFFSMIFLVICMILRFVFPSLIDSFFSLKPIIFLYLSIIPVSLAIYFDAKTFKNLIKKFP